MELGDETIDEIQITQRLTGDMYKSLPAQGIKFADLFKLASKITGVSVNFINRMDASDLNKLIQIVTAFLGSGVLED